MDPAGDSAFQMKLKEVEAEIAQREKQQGLGKPIISVDFQGQRIVAVGAKLYHSPNWKTFHDFLREYVFMVLGKDWLDDQQKKTFLEKHQILRWHDKALNEARNAKKGKNGIAFGAMTGAQRAFLNLAYNLYLISHHSDPAIASKVLDSFVGRLKSARTDDFIGKLFETYASAAFLKAGFEIEYENEKDGSDSHVEFTATYPETGRKFAVEVKARNSLIGIDGPNDEVKRLRVAQKLTKALRKSTEHERIVFIEVNIPDVVGEDYSGTWVEAAIKQVNVAENFLDGSGKLYPPAYVVVTNHAFHNNLDAADSGLQAVADGFRIPDFGPRARVNRLKEYLEGLEKHREMFVFFDSLKEHSHIPATFDGEIPEFEFGEEDRNPRLRIGYEYQIPDKDGNHVSGVLEQAVVVESWGKAQAVYRLQDGSNVMVSHELSETELSAWRQHPETFFGRLEERQTRSTNWIELAAFFYRTYKNSSKEKLLEFMANHEDNEYLAGLKQNELAILYCERMGWSAWNHADRKPEGGEDTGD